MRLRTGFVAVAVFLGVGVSALGAQFRIIEAATGSGNPDLRDLKAGMVLGDLMWDGGEYQDGWATSFLPAEGKAPVPKYPGTDDPELAGEDNFALTSWSEMYAPLKLLDGDPATCWVEGARGSGAGEVVVVPLAGTAFSIWNGFQKSKDLFLRNGRVKGLRIWVFTAWPMAAQFGTGYSGIRVVGFRDVELKDVMGSQALRVPPAPVLERDEEHGLHQTTLVGLQILSVYPGSKYEDTCISGLEAR